MAGVLGKWDAIRSALATLAAHHHVPGASLAVLDGDLVVEAVTGVVNRNTGVEVTSDTLFQIGSNTKLYTATLVMQLVESGRVDLDAPVRRYIDDFRLAQPEAAEKAFHQQGHGWPCRPRARAGGADGSNGWTQPEGRLCTPTSKPTLAR